MFGAIFMRFILPIAFFAVSFWPDWGLVWWAAAFFPQYPYATSLAVALWSILLCLILPLPMRVFRWVSTAFIAASMIAVTLSAWAAGYLPPLTMQMAIIYAILFFGMILGWMMTATRVWRFVHAIVAVEDQHQ